MNTSTQGTKPIYKIHKSEETQHIDRTKSPDQISVNVPKITPKSLAEYLFKKYPLSKIHSVLSLYDHIGGYYKPLTSGRGDQYIRMITPPQFHSYINHNFILEVIKWLESMPIPEATPAQLTVSSQFHLNFADGVLNILNDKFIPHNPHMVFTSYIPFSYKNCRQSGLPLTLDKWISRITKENQDHLELLAQVFGYLLSEYRRSKHMFIFFGPSNTGKSVWLDMMRNAIGPDFTKSIPLHSLINNFRTSELVGTKANIFSEIEHRRVTNIDIIKALIGGAEKLNVDVKNSKPIEFYNSAAFVYGTNSLEFTRVIDPGNALSNRLLIIPFDNIIAEEHRDDYFPYKLFEELPSIIFHFAITGFRHFVLNNFKFNTSAAINLSNREQQAEKEAINFLQCYCQFGSSHKIHVDILHDAYCFYCDQRRLSPLPRGVFRKVLDRLHLNLNIAPLTFEDHLRVNGQQRTGYIGIDLLGSN